jgi:hypothetical protein|tara:strand:- start:422 stop:1393 length:972 start_codon:yes stop_codon:yes gene_type:complete
MKSVFATEKSSLVKDITLIDGLTRSGKFFLAKIVSGLNKTEFFQYLHILEQLPYVFRLGGIAEDAAIALLRSAIDRHTYDACFGRHLNFRHDDESSIFNFPGFNNYFMRAFKKYERKEIIGILQSNERMFLFLTHNVLPNTKILFNAFPNMKMINILRHPIDLAYSWFLKGYGNIDNPDLLRINPDISGLSYPVPWYVCKWEEEYDSINDIERIIKSICVLTEMGRGTYGMLIKEHKKKILFVRYEDLVKDTHKTIRSMCDFLGTEESEYMPQILARERCPNNLPDQIRIKKTQEISERARDYYTSMLLKLSEEYDNNKDYIE